MAKTSRRVLCMASLFFVGCLIMTSSVAHAALQTVLSEQSSDAFLKKMADPGRGLHHF
jgi:hypothetical protein